MRINSAHRMGPRTAGPLLVIIPDCRRHKSFKERERLTSRRPHRPGVGKFGSYLIIPPAAECIGMTCCVVGPGDSLDCPARSLCRSLRIYRTHYRQTSMLCGASLCVPENDILNSKQHHNCALVSR